LQRNSENQKLPGLQLFSGVVQFQQPTIIPPPIVVQQPAIGLPPLPVAAAILPPPAAPSMMPAELFAKMNTEAQQKQQVIISSIL
jgi:hypothetical protein